MLPGLEPAAIPACYETRVDLHILSLVLTENCNLHCSYCYQPDRVKGKMSLATAQAAVANALERHDQFREVVIELIGGEVLIHWPLVTELIDWTIEQQRRWSKKFTFFIDTNGTLLNDERKAWIRTRLPYLSMGLSLDGTPHAHNINRSNSYARVAPHLAFFAEHWPHQTVKMTISPATIPEVFEGIVHIMRRGLRVAANFPLEDIWGSPLENERHVAAFREQIDLLVEFFGEQYQLPLPSLINLPIQVLWADEERDRPWCGSGRSMAGIDVDGTWLPCNRYARMSFDRALWQKPVRRGESRCNSCFFRPACQTCEAHNWEKTGNPNVRTSFHCEFVKLQVWGTAQVRAVRLRRWVEALKQRLELEPSHDSPEWTAIRDRICFAYAQLDSLADTLEIFERADSLEGAGAGYYKENAFEPPLQPVWTVPRANSPRRSVWPITVV